MYAGVVEHSVYVDPAAQGRGVGAALIQALIDSTEAAGIWTIQSGVFPENTASLRLHERAGSASSASGCVSAGITAVGATSSSSSAAAPSPVRTETPVRGQTSRTRTSRQRVDEQHAHRDHEYRPHGERPEERQLPDGHQYRHGHAGRAGPRLPLRMPAADGDLHDAEDQPDPAPGGEIEDQQS